MEKVKRVLIVTYYWPPSGGGGVQRWLKFIKYLPQFGWAPYAAVPENPEYPVIDESLMNDIPENSEIIYLPIWEPYDIFKKLTGRKKDEKVNTGILFDDSSRSLIEKISLWIRGNILIPDPRVFWVRPSIKRLKKKIKTIKPEAIITTGPPHSVHLIGLGLKKAFPEIKWIADFRDPWSEFDLLDNFYPSKLALRRQCKLEKKVLDTANSVLTVSPSWVLELQKFTKTKIAFVANGYDTDDFSFIEESRPSDFIISYAGIINSYRNPEAFWEALEESCEQVPGFSDHLKIQIIGINDNGLKNMIDKYPRVAQRTKIVGYVPHNEVVKLYSKSSCLLLLLNNTKNSKGHIPGKFFEYLAAKKPILIIGPVESDIGIIVHDFKVGRVCEFNDKERMKMAILDLYEDWRTNTITDVQGAVEFSRERLTEKLVEILNH